MTGWLEALYQRHRTVMLTAAALAAVAFPFTQGGTAQWIRVFTSIGILAAAAIGLNVVVGLAGLLDLGYIAFFGVGAYVAALVSGAGVTTSDVVLPFGVAMLLGACAAAVFGVMIGGADPAVAGRLPGHRHAGLRRDLPDRRQQLEQRHPGPERHCPASPTWPSATSTSASRHELLGFELPALRQLLLPRARSCSPG